jgi:Zn-dependent protease/CBS domain-containing protein
MGNGFRLGSVLGFEIRIDYSWFVIFFLILWSLSAGLFPQEVPGRSGGVYLAMGTAGTLLFFASLLAHELSHSVVARSKGIEVEGITLFIFGGMARTRLESENPSDEMLIAGVGPLMSFVLAAAFWGMAELGRTLGWSPAIHHVATYLAFINLLLAVFNLLPGFPLDGGRLFRAVAWQATGNLGKATRWATEGGKWLGYGLMALGFLEAFAGGVLGGLWLVFIGWFLRSTAEMSFQQHTLSRALQGVTAGRIMSRDPETVPPQMTIRELVDDRLLRRRYQSFPVVNGQRVEGMITLEQVKAHPRGEWDATRVSDLMTPAGDDLIVAPEEEMMDVLRRMRDSGTRRVMVVEDGRLEGIVSNSDVTRWVQRAHDLGLDQDDDLRA